MKNAEGCRLSYLYALGSACLLQCMAVASYEHVPNARSCARRSALTQNAACKRTIRLCEKMIFA